MRVICPKVEVLSAVDGVAAVKHLEKIGRVCYKSESRITEDSYARFLQGIVDRSHEAVLEHYSISVKFTCDRGVSHEIVRHRMASYCQESTRYCSYNNEQFGKEITVIKPCFLNEDTGAYSIWKHSMESVEKDYFNLLAAGCTAQEARAVLPNSLKTELVMSANIREWRHFFKLRCSAVAHPQMREVALLALKELYDLVPVVFDDLYKEFLS